MGRVFRLLLTVLVLAGIPLALTACSTSPLVLSEAEEGNSEEKNDGGSVSEPISLLPGKRSPVTEDGAGTGRAPPGTAPRLMSDAERERAEAELAALAARSRGRVATGKPRYRTDDLTRLGTEKKSGATDGE